MNGISKSFMIVLFSWTKNFINSLIDFVNGNHTTGLFQIIIDYYYIFVILIVVIGTLFDIVISFYKKSKAN